MLRIHQHEKAGIGVVRPHGRMNFTTRTVCRRRSTRCWPAGSATFLSLGGLASDDGFAISASLQLLDRVRAVGGDIRVVDAARRMGLVTMTSLCVHFTICGTEPETIAGFLSDPRPQNAGAPAPWSAVAATA